MWDNKDTEAKSCIYKLNNLTGKQQKAYLHLIDGTVIKTDDGGLMMKLGNHELHIAKNSEVKWVFGESREYSTGEILRGWVKTFAADVKKDGLSIDLIIKTAVVAMGVRGTEFIVGHDPSTSTSTVLLLEGIIDVTTDGETRTFSGENKFTVDDSGIIVDKVFSIYEWNGLSDEIKSDIDSLTETEPNKIVSGDYLENIKIESANEEYFITANIGQKSPNTSSVRIIVENECPFKKEILVKDFQYMPGADVSYSFEQLSASKPSECTLHFTLSTFEGKELETIVANYYLDIPDTESDYIACTAQWDPVCGINGMTYGNDCEAYVDGVEISSLGECSVRDGPLIFPPSAPTSLLASVSDGSILLNWETPDNEGGWEGLVNDYIIEYKSESDSTWQVYDDGWDESTSAIITGLQGDVQYQFRVSGSNDAIDGLGAASTIVTATVPEIWIDPTPSNPGGGCLIATATYGSELSPQVQLLRELRDNSLLNTESGTSFINIFNDVYYTFSPYIADFERENSVFKEAVKITITPLITSLSILNYVDMDSEFEVLGYGISLIILNLAMYVGIPVVVIVGIRKYV